MQLPSGGVGSTRLWLEAFGGVQVALNVDQSAVFDGVDTHGSRAALDREIGVSAASRVVDRNRTASTVQVNSEAVVLVTVQDGNRQVAGTGQ